MDWGKKWLIDFNAGETQLVLLNQSINTGSIDIKMDGSYIEEESSFKMLGLIVSSILDWGSYTISISKTASQKIEPLTRNNTFKPLICSMKFFFLKLLCISIELPCSHVWNTVVTSGLVPLVAT